MKLAITMTAYRRPDYTRQVLASLAECQGVEECLFLPQVEPGCDETIAAFDGFAACEMQLVVNDHRRGLNKNTLAALVRARRHQAEAVLHIEDDTVLAPDALRYYRWALDRFRDKPRVYSIAGYNKADVDPSSIPFECRRRGWFTCWGWAMWSDRLRQTLVNWCTRNPKSFATHLNHRVRGGRREVFPVLSRVQNIGYQDGENGRTPQWYESNHRVRWVADHSTLALPPDYHLQKDRR